MRLEIDGKWNKGFTHDGMLFFAQRLEEMLNHYTNHLYKVPILNTYLLIKEYLNTAQLIKKEIISGEHLKFIMEEFQYSFTRDIIIKNYIEEEKIKFILQKLNESSQDDQERLMHYLLYTLRNYNYWCKEFLRNIVEEENQKKKIDMALRSYLPGLIGAGYSQEYIFYFCKKVFKEQKVESLESLDFFLKRFDFLKRKYTVYVPIEKGLERFKNILEKRIGVSFDVDEYQKKLKCDRNRYSILWLEVEALDEKKAAEQAFERIDLFFRYYKFLGDRKEGILFNKGMVRDEEGNCAFLDLKSIGYNYDASSDDEVIGEVSESLITGLVTMAIEDFPTIDKSIRLHDLAIETRDLKNSFLNFWSILEILCVKKKKQSIIGEIESTILPVLKKDYVCLIFEEINKYLENCLESVDYKKLMEELGEGVIDYKIARLIILDKNEFLRNELYSKLESYPLIRSRISQLHEKYKIKNGMYEDIERFSERVKWHLRRLYRTRNAIVHSGEVPENLKLLGEHLHSYVDEVLFEISINIVMGKNLCTIDNVLLDAKFSIESICSTLKSKKNFEELDLKMIFELSFFNEFTLSKG